MVDHVIEDPTHVEGRPPSGSRLDLPNRRLPVEGVLDSDSVDLVVGNKAELGTGAGQLADTLREVEDLDPIGGADVENLARDRVLVHQAVQRPNRVGDVTERASLRPVTMHFER